MYHITKQKFDELNISRSHVQDLSWLSKWLSKSSL